MYEIQQNEDGAEDGNLQEKKDQHMHQMIGYFQGNKQYLIEEPQHQPQFAKNQNTSFPNSELQTLNNKYENSLLQILELEQYIHRLQNNHSQEMQNLIRNIRQKDYQINQLLNREKENLLLQKENKQNQIMELENKHMLFNEEKMDLVRQIQHRGIRIRELENQLNQLQSKQNKIQTNYNQKRNETENFGSELTTLKKNNYQQSTNMLNENDIFAQQCRKPDEKLRKYNSNPTLFQQTKKQKDPNKLISSIYFRKKCNLNQKLLKVQKQQQHWQFPSTPLNPHTITVRLLSINKGKSQISKYPQSYLCTCNK